MIRYWEPLKVYVEDDLVVSTSQNYFQYRCNTGGTSGSTEPLWPETPGETVSESGDLVWVTEEYSAAEEQIHRETFFGLLPLMWKAQDELGVLERFLGVWDKAFEANDQKIASILATRSIESIPDKYLVLLGNLVGHRWKGSKDYQWNRQRISELVTRYSYKGTDLSIKDLAFEHDSAFCEIIDMASKVGVWSVQGVPLEDNCYFFDSDFFHPGVFLIYLSETVNLSDFIEDFQYIRPAGTKWYYYIQPDVIKNDLGILSQSDMNIHMDLTPSSRIAIFNQSFYAGLRQPGLCINQPVYFTNDLVDWGDSSITFGPESTTYL
jgi:hypothetical protein